MKVALGVCGGIAAYKAAEIVRLLQDRGIRVQVIMTASAQEFVRPLTFAALSGEKVITGMFSEAAGSEPNIESSTLRWRRRLMRCSWFQQQPMS
jgi:phosphopantothenoylcysteine decarboxylase / phosphopantothenate---cysteine ligase